MGKYQGWIHISNTGGNEDYFVWETVVNAAFAILYIASAVFHLRRGEKKSALLSVMIVLLLIGSCLYEWHYLNEMRELQ